MRILAAVALLSLVACAVPDEDERGDAFLIDGKADAARVAEGTPLALGVLRLVNEADLARLLSVPLARRAAQNVLAHRAGPDGRPGTPDDDAFDTLAELDAVPWVGPVSFERLVAFAQEHGLVVETLVAHGTCHETTKVWAGDCFLTRSERDLRVDVELTLGDGSVAITSMREEFALGQYLCRVALGSGCPAVMAAPVVLTLDAAGNAWHPALGSSGTFHADLAPAKVDLAFSAEGDRRDGVCRGTVVRSFCTVSATR